MRGELQLSHFVGSHVAIGYVDAPIINDETIKIVDRHRLYCSENNCKIEFENDDMVVEVYSEYTLYRKDQIVPVTNIVGETTMCDISAWFEEKIK